ncbi:hypothetical protein KC19_12G175900 [Ceratodon purpureus]|uniref:Uncharacterized protein n=1 Tax=Ceratodon purpureus TaxID=3225 RepID=A0A8T0GE94_CERPU|nr:hypothetical protein KC19_12G175900 [Ceratodon purpureus]
MMKLQITDPIWPEFDSPLLRLPMRHRLLLLLPLLLLLLIKFSRVEGDEDGKSASKQQRDRPQDRPWHERPCICRSR